MDVSIIIVNYNTKELLRNCLVSIYEQTKDINFEIIVSDNGSTDGSIKMLKTKFPQVILIENNSNLGFGSANNRGLDRAKGKYVFYLNSDTVLLNNAVKLFYDYWENYPDKEHLGAIGCNLLDENRQITHSYGDFPTTMKSLKELLRLNAALLVKTFFRLIHYDYQHLRKKVYNSFFIGNVDYITGADLFMENTASSRFDERFFLYFEESNMQYQLFLNGKERILINGPVIQHILGGSNNIKDDFDIYASFSMIQYFISNILYLVINRKKGIFFVKLLIVFLLCNPYLIKKNYKYIKSILFAGKNFL
jgi:GT2 family glycosyltransferase